MARLSLKQLLFAIALGALFAALQGEAPVPALAKLVPCASQQTTRC
jgi:hypothetical protein